MFHLLKFLHTYIDYIKQYLFCIVSFNYEIKSIIAFLKCIMYCTLYYEHWVSKCLISGSFEVQFSQCWFLWCCMLCIMPKKLWWRSIDWKETICRCCSTFQSQTGLVLDTPVFLKPSPHGPNVQLKSTLLLLSILS